MCAKGPLRGGGLAVLALDDLRLRQACDGAFRAAIADAYRACTDNADAEYYAGSAAEPAAWRLRLGS